MSVQVNIGFQHLKIIMKVCWLPQVGEVVWLSTASQQTIYNMDNGYAWLDSFLESKDSEALSQIILLYFKSNIRQFNKYSIWIYSALKYPFKRGEIVWFQFFFVYWFQSSYFKFIDYLWDPFQNMSLWSINEMFCLFLLSFCPCVS